MKGLGTDEDVILDIIIRRSNAQRQTLKKRYHELYNKDLESELKSELSGDLEEVVLGLMMPPVEYDAHCLHEAMKGLGTTEDVLIGILSNRTSKELAAIKKQYKTAYKKDLEKDIEGDTSGDFKDIMLTLAKGQRDQGTKVDNKMAEEDAKKLHNDGVALLASDDVFTDILAKKNKAQVKATFFEYKKMTGQSVEEAIKRATSGDTEEAYLALAKTIDDPAEFYTDSIHEAFSGIGTNDNTLIRIVVARSEIDLGEIQTRYEDKYGKSLSEQVRGDCSGDYQRALLKILDKHSPLNKKGGNKKNAGANNKKGTQAGGKDNKKKDSTSPSEEEDDAALRGDAKRIHDAMDGFGTDEDVVLDVIVERTNTQRQSLKKKYQTLYKKDLMKDLESELTGDFEELMLGLMMKPADYDAHCLREAVKGLGTNEHVLIGILVTRSSQDIAGIKKAYKTAYKHELEEDIKDDTSGGFSDLLLGLMKDQRSNETKVDKNLAQEDAKYFAKGDNTMKASDPKFKDLMIRTSRAQVRSTFEEYKKLTGHHMMDDIRKANSGDTEDGYVALAKAIDDPAQFYADRLNKAFKGLGTDDSALIRIIVSRAEVDLGEIKTAYQATYKSSLSSDIKKECSGDYQRALMKIVDSASTKHVAY